MGILFKYRRARHRRILAFRPFVSTLLPPLFFPFSLFFFFSSKKINVIDLSSIPVLLYHRFFYSFIFNSSSACARVFYFFATIYRLCFFSVASKGRKSVRRGGRRNRAVRDPLTSARLVFHIDRLSLEN